MKRLNWLISACDNSERDKLRTRLEESRDNLAKEKIELQNEIARLDIENEKAKEEMDRLEKKNKMLEGTLGVFVNDKVVDLKKGGDKKQPWEIRLLKKENPNSWVGCHFWGMQVQKKRVRDFGKSCKSGLKI